MWSPSCSKLTSWESHFRRPKVHPADRNAFRNLQCCEHETFGQPVENVSHQSQWNPGGGGEWRRASFCWQKSQETDTRSNWLWLRGKLLSPLLVSEVHACGRESAGAYRSQEYVICTEVVSDDFSSQTAFHLRIAITMFPYFKLWSNPVS